MSKVDSLESTIGDLEREKGALIIRATGLQERGDDALAEQVSAPSPSPHCRWGVGEVVDGEGGLIGRLDSSRTSRRGTRCSTDFGLEWQRSRDSIGNCSDGMRSRRVCSSVSFLPDTMLGQSQAEDCGGCEV